MPCKLMQISAIALAIGLAAHPARATLQIAFANSGGGSAFCADQTACDLRRSSFFARAAG